MPDLPVYSDVSATTPATGSTPTTPTSPARTCSAGTATRIRHFWSGEMTESDPGQDPRGAPRDRPALGRARHGPATGGRRPDWSTPACNWAGAAACRPGRGPASGPLGRLAPRPPSVYGPRRHTPRTPHAPHHRRSLRQDPPGPRHPRRLRDHRLGLHADLGPLPQGRHPLLGLRARGLGRDDGRRLHPRLRADVHDDRPERPRHHQPRDRRQDRLLEPHAAPRGDAAGREPHHRPGRLPGGGADGALPRHGRLPGGGPRPRPHGRGPGPRHRQGPPPLRPRPDQHPPRLLDARDRRGPPPALDFERPSGGAQALDEAAAPPGRAPSAP